MVAFKFTKSMYENIHLSTTVGSMRARAFNLLSQAEIFTKGYQESKPITIVVKSELCYVYHSRTVVRYTEAKNEMFE